MELDHLKSNWNSISVDLSHNEFDIISATKKEMESPFSALKKNSKKQTVILPLLFSFLMVMRTVVPEMKTHLLIWMALVVLPLTTLYYYFNIRLINELEETQGNVKSDFQRKVARLIKSNNLYLNIIRIMLVALIILTEFLLQRNNSQLIPSIEILKTIILPLRLLIYAGVIAAHYIISLYTFNFYFGKYLKHLKSLLTEMG